MKKYLRLTLFAILITGVQFVQFFAHMFTDKETNDGAIVYADVPSGGEPPGDGGTNCVDAGGAASDAGAGADSGGCFPAGTLVSTPTGVKEIQTIVIDDSVYGFDTLTGAIVTSTVTKTMKHTWEEMGTASPLIIITHTKGKIILTINHPVYKKGSISQEGYQDFENAGVLKIGDFLTLESGEEVEITNIADGEKYDYVYNIEVDQVHTYIAENIWVHNKP